MRSYSLIPDSWDGWEDKLQECCKASHEEKTPDAALLSPLISENSPSDECNTRSYKRLWLSLRRIFAEPLKNPGLEQEAWWKG